MGTEGKLHPYYRASLISRITLWWIFGILRTGYGRPLQHDDLYPVRDEEQAERLTRRLIRKWNEEKKIAKAVKKRPLLWKALLRFFTWSDYAYIVVVGIVEAMAYNLAWCCTIMLIDVFGYGTNLSSSEFSGLVLTYGLALSQLVNLIAGQHFQLHSVFLGIRARAAALGLLYREILCRSQSSMTAGHVMELVSDDSQRLVTNSEYSFQYGARYALRWAGSLIWLFYFAGWQPVVASLVLVIVGFYRYLIAKTDYNLRKNVSRLADERLGYLREILTGIQSIKLNCWEEIIEKKVYKIRRQEIVAKTKRWSIMAVCRSFNYNGHRLATFFTIILILFTSNKPLTYTAIFAIIIYSTFARENFCNAIPQAILSVTEIRASLERMQAFLDFRTKTADLYSAYSEHKDGKQQHKFGDSLESKMASSYEMESLVIKRDRSHLSNDTPPPANVGPGKEDSAPVAPVVSLNDVTCKLPLHFTHESNNGNKPLINYFSLNVSERGLILIMGHVGSGKSSILTCVLGDELHVSHGIVKRSGKVAYVSQTPWVFPGTIRENILFGLPFNEEWFLKTIEVCQMEMDLKMFPEGDLSVIGEHGSTVSGGQRTRIALARAVYSQADIYLLDDPLSSLDVKVADNVFHQCIRGLLADRIVILATHHLRYLNEADYIVKLKRGVAVAQGDYSSMKDQFNETEFAEKKEETLTMKDVENTSGKVSEDIEKEKPAGEALRQVDEDRETGNVSYKVYWEYFTTGAPTIILVVGGLLCCFAQGLSMTFDIAISRLPKLSSGNQNMSSVFVSSSLVLVTTCVLGFLFTFSSYIVLLNASQVVHSKMVRCILRAPLSFHSLNPVGRIMNRFSQDIITLDDILPSAFLAFFWDFVWTFSVFVLASITKPLVFPAILVIVVIFSLMTKFYCRSVIDIKRLTSIGCGPLYSHFSNTMEGIKDIRVYQRQKMFTKSLYSHIDAHDQALFAYYTAVRWFGIVLELTSVLLLAVVCLILILTASGSNPALIGLTIFYINGIIAPMQYDVRMFADTQSSMTSAERTLAYTKIPAEKGHDVVKEPPDNWPSDGKIQAKDVSLRHYEGGPKVLRNLTFEIRPSEKVGIAGRTGAGKSSLVAALMRMADVEGEIIIDGVNIKELNAKSIRSSISVIYQSPVLLSSRIRENLDPRFEFTDNEIWDALDHMQMKSVVSSLPDQLETVIAGTGSNFSVGERQLLHLARVLLQKSKIIIFDEATANVDQNVDEIIKQKMCNEFKNCTVIIIAHRLNTILDCNRVMLLDHGEILEFDEPKVLLEKEDGFFKKFYKISRGN